MNFRTSVVSPTPPFPLLSHLQLLDWEETPCPRTRPRPLVDFLNSRPGPDDSDRTDRAINRRVVLRVPVELRVYRPQLRVSDPLRELGEVTSSSLSKLRPYSLVPVPVRVGHRRKVNKWEGGRPPDVGSQLGESSLLTQTGSHLVLNKVFVEKFHHTK